MEKKETNEAKRKNNGKVGAFLLVLLAIVLLIFIATKVFKKDTTKTSGSTTQNPAQSSQTVNSAAQSSSSTAQAATPTNTASSTETANSETTVAENKVEIEEFVAQTEDGGKVNSNSKINQTRQVGNFKFTNFQLTEKDNQSTLLATVENTSGKDITNYTDLDITFYAKDGSEIVKIKGLLAPIKAGETTQLNAGLTQDIANAYDVKIEISK